jgi:hypothetical protein
VRFYLSGNNDGITVTLYDGLGRVVNIPNKINGLSVVVVTLKSRV